MASLSSCRSLLLITGGLSLACGGSTPPEAAAPAPQYAAQQQYPPQAPQQQYPTQAPQQYPAPAPAAQPYPAPAAQPYPTAAPAAVPPPAAPPMAMPPGVPPIAVPPGMVAAPGAMATPLDPSAVAAVQPILRQLAATQAPAGAKPIGSVMAGNFLQGQVLEAQVQMEPGKCYTVVGAGVPPTVQELELQLLAVTPMPGMAPVLAVDHTAGPQAVLGAKPNCYKWAWPIAAPVKISIRMKAGQGLAAAQLFVK